MSKPVFIIFKDTLINVEDISWAKIDLVMTYYDPDKPWTMTINFRGSDQTRWFFFETQAEVKDAYQRLQHLVMDALRRMD